MNKVDTAPVMEHQTFLKITMGSTPGLIVIDGPKAGTVFYVKSEYATIGETADNDITLQAQGVEPFHAIIRWHPHNPYKRFFVYDMSNNNIRVNGSPVYLRHPLDQGDRITIGSAVLEFFV